MQLNKNQAAHITNTSGGSLLDIPTHLLLGKSGTARSDARSVISQISQLSQMSDISGVSGVDHISIYTHILNLEKI